PLRGDASGHYRVHVIGNSGALNSAEVAALLGIPHIPLDTVYWNPNWEKTPSSVFKDRVTAMLQDSENSHGGWVVDGNYNSYLGDLIADSTTDVLWLDPPLALYLPRLCLRTLKRLFGLVPPCSPNCPERVSEAFFSKDSIIWYSISHHWSLRKRESERYAVDGIHAGGKIRRLGGWGKDRAEWLRAVRAMVDG
ncbi:hypothetical protein HETIRDRAFT_247000, partial [Heterobasidion irregulare TC 32-1]